ncbi:unnamed protein product [Prorocentrum cordatum]|uniref:Folate receptor-like domain-containing protein n=1 Tax=Prorocentrum cordatum TaxID=2364126 RepID=A0ABN9WD94_9DINO|nr:unnamed protein product [Polarella glacialis]
MWCLVRGMLALICYARADVQLLQLVAQGSQDGGAGPESDQDCHTSVEGDECYEKVVWAMRTGVGDHPEWYAPLTGNSSFEDFQRFLHSMARLSNVCPEPCADQDSGARLPARLPAGAEDDCHTSVEGDECYEKVAWAMRTGVGDHPEWYAPLTGNSSFEDFQRLLHSTARLSNVCPVPCTLETSAGHCRTSVQGDACYEKVVRAMQIGVVDHPDWYAPLTARSSFKQFQQFLHGVDSLSHVCPEPCASQAGETDCHTSVEGDACHEKVVWAMQFGFQQHPEWYAPLAWNSSFEDFQRLLHSTARLSLVCPEPCAEQDSGTQLPARLPAGAEECHTSVEGDDCYEKVKWAMHTGIMKVPEWYVPLTRHSSFEDFQQLLHDTPRLSRTCPRPCLPLTAPERLGTPMPTEIHFDELFNSTYPGFAQVATNCMCGNSMFGGQLNDEFTTLERCAEECRYRPTCLAFGLHPWQSIWNGHCDLFDVACNYTDGHAAGTTCSDPLPDGALNVVFNKIPTPQPTASPTPAALVDPCDVTDGSSPSQVYPCSCGTETCFSSEICSRDRSGELRARRRST